MATQTRPITLYFDALIESYGLFAEAATRASERATRLASLAGAEFVTAQREGIELARELSTEQVDAADLLPRYTKLSVKAQDHVAKFAKASLQESLDAASDYREVTQKLFESNRKLAEAFVEATAEFANGQTVADAIQAFTPPAEPKKKAAATAS
jgi:hypothetical protein